jgi:hypothetical protein
MAALARARALSAARSASGAARTTLKPAGGSSVSTFRFRLGRDVVTHRDTSKVARTYGYCLTYCRTGRCEKQEAGACEKVHDATKVLNIAVVKA